MGGLSIRIYADAMYRHHASFGGLFARGLLRHGIEAPCLSNRNYEPSDLAVVWGYRQKPIMEAQRSRGLDFLVMEMGYAGNREKWISLGYNGLNGYAEFHNQGSPGDRWKKLGIELKPWRFGGYHILLLGQVKGDANLENVNIDRWYFEVAALLEKKYSFPVFFRPHPKARQKAPDIGIRCLGGSLDEALADAALAVAWNSNSLVDAVIAGVPVAAGDSGSMAWPLSGNINGCFYYPDRTQWAHDLAYCQWSKEEIESGDAWAHLKRRYEQ